MNRQSSSSERGQAVVLIVLAMVVLLGFTALAVDGSMVYADRRNSQNAADASSLAGGTTIAAGLENAGVQYSSWQASPPNCEGHVFNSVNDAKSKARSRAQDNGFTVPNSYAENASGVKGECNQTNINAPVGNGHTATIFVDKYVDFTAQITHKTDTAFAHFVTSGDLTNTVSAVTRIRPRQALAYGNAIVALNPDTGNCNSTSNGLVMHGLGGNGSNGLTVDGGGLWSNGCMNAFGNANVTVTNGGAFYFGTANNPTLDIIDFDAGVTPQKITDVSYRLPESMYNIAPPDCSGREFTSNQLKQMYEDARDEGAEHLPSQLYCVTNELRLNGGDELIFDASTLVLYAGMTVNANATFQISTIMPNVTPTGAIPGLIIYQQPPRNAPITINGNSDLILRGTILAPRTDITILGDAVSRMIMSQIIGWNVEIGGSSGTEVVWREDKQIHRPATLELLR